MKENEAVEWYLKYLKEHTSDMSENDLDWTIRLEDSYKKKEYLSDREIEILEDIYRRQK